MKGCFFLMYFDSICLVFGACQQKKGAIKCMYAWCVFANVCIYSCDRFLRGRPIPVGYKRPIDPTPPLTHALFYSSLKEEHCPHCSTSLAVSVCISHCLYNRETLRKTEKQIGENEGQRKDIEFEREKKRKEGEKVTKTGTSVVLTVNSNKHIGFK